MQLSFKECPLGTRYTFDSILLILVCLFNFELAKRTFRIQCVVKAVWYVYFIHTGKTKNNQMHLHFFVADIWNATYYVANRCSNFLYILFQGKKSMFSWESNWANRAKTDTEALQFCLNSKLSITHSRIIIPGISNVNIENSKQRKKTLNRISNCGIEIDGPQLPKTLHCRRMQMLSSFHVISRNDATSAC